MIGVLKTLPASTAAFGGIESIVLLTDSCKDPKRDMAKGLVAAMHTLFEVACACPPGLIDGAFAEMPYFMNAGFALGGLKFTGNVSE